MCIFIHAREASFFKDTMYFGHHKLGIIYGSSYQKLFIMIYIHLYLVEELGTILTCGIVIIISSSI